MITLKEGGGRGGERGGRGGKGGGRGGGEGGGEGRGWGGKGGQGERPEQPMPSHQCMVYILDFRDTPCLAE